MGPTFRCVLSFLAGALMVAAAGCGLVLDAAPPSAAVGPGDGGPDRDADAGRDSAPVDAVADAPWDAMGPCFGTPSSVDLGDLEDLEPGVEPVGVDDGCTVQRWAPSGAVIGGTPRVQPSSGGGVPIVYLRTAAMDQGALTVDFGRPVAISFVFEWLSFNPPVEYDERLIITVDGVAVVPSLSDAVSTRVEGTEVRSLGPKGDGRIQVDRVTRLGIVLRNAGPAEGVGIELHSFEYTALRP